jgi:LmbE family N-acetylglucosaminyl deacetylase
MNRFTLVLVILCLFGSTRTALAQQGGLADLAAALDALDVATRVLVIAAHPDDEDTQLITWLARGRQVETAYLSLTRGDGGQNLIGNELGEALGVLRTEELLAARRIDGGRQYFARAFDFGYSKSAEETFRHWPRDSLLYDVITVVRAFRPHVIVSVFSGTPRDGHGHHQVAGIVARQAYDLASDTLAVPRNINRWNLPGWTPLKFYRGARFWPETATLTINVGEYSRLFGRSFAEIAAESRSQHRSQGFGALQRRGVVLNHLRREHSRAPAPEDATRERSIFDGLNLSLPEKLAGLALPTTDRERLAMLPAAITTAQATSLRRPDSLVVRLARVQELLEAPLTRAEHEGFGSAAARALAVSAALPHRAQQVLQAGYERAAHALVLATGVALEAEAERELIATGDSARVRLALHNRGTHALRVTPQEFFSCANHGLPSPTPHGTGAALQAVDSAALVLPDSTQVWRGWLCGGHEPTQPYWLVAPRHGSLFTTNEVGIAEEVINRGPVLQARVEILETGTVRPPGIDVEAQVVYRFADPVRGDVRRVVAFVPRISVVLDGTVQYAPANTILRRQITVQLRSAAKAEETAQLRIQLPAGMRADSALRTVVLAAGGVRQVSFWIEGELAPGRDTLRLIAENRGERFASGYVPIEYEHIRAQRRYRPAELALEAVDIRVPAGLRVAYIAGVGDNVAPGLEQLGLDVTELDAAVVGSTDLRGFDAVVIGPRAYQSWPQLVEQRARLLDYVRDGGRLVVQYGQYEMTGPGIMPYPIELTRPQIRVTQEDAPVRFLAPDHPLLNRPNRIVPADFDNWVQERALYMPASFDPAYTPLLEMSDPGEPPNQGALLVAPYGQGTYVYTTLALFRQLPAGVPGAARLLVNLIASPAPPGE